MGQIVETEKDTMYAEARSKSFILYRNEVEGDEIEFDWTEWDELMELLELLKKHKPT